MKQLVVEICRAKREGGIFPVCASELDLKRELSRKGIKWTLEAFSLWLEELKAEPDIIVHEALNFYTFYYADNTQEQQEDLSAEAHRAGQTNTGEYSILPKSAVEKSEAAISGTTSTVRGVPDEGEDNTSDGGGSHHTDKYWWREI